MKSLYLWLENGIEEITKKQTDEISRYLDNLVDEGAVHVEGYVKNKLGIISIAVMPLIKDYISTYCRSTKNRTKHGLKTAVKIGSLEKVINENYERYVNFGSSEKHIDESHRLYRKYDGLRKKEFSNVVEFFRELIDTGGKSFGEMFYSAFNGRNLDEILSFLDASKERVDIIMKNPSILTNTAARLIAGYAGDAEKRALDFIKAKIKTALKL